MFGWIKSHVKKGNTDDYGDLRTGILGEPVESFSQQPAQPPEPYGRSYDEFTPRTRDIFEPIQTTSLPTQDFDKPGPSREYDIMDRLNLIESQIAAVRSMTETINERLKNMESKLVMQRRY